MSYFKIFLLLLIISIPIASCSDNPTNLNKVSQKGTLIYNVDQYDNTPSYDSKVQVTYRNLKDELVIDTVQVPWKKQFKYNYLTSPDSLEDFNANLVVEYNGENVVFLKASIQAEKVKDGSNFGKSFIINLGTTFNLP